MRKIEYDKKNVNGHLEKSIHNLKAMVNFKSQGFSDWSASASFYCLYHALLALIAKFGYESRNQSCTFELVEEFIKQKKITLTITELKEIFDKDITENLEHSNKILDIRENMQYSTKTALEDEEFIELQRRTKELFDKIRRNIEE